MAKYKDLIVFQKANELAFRVYKLTEKFPENEIFGITSSDPKVGSFHSDEHS